MTVIRIEGAFKVTYFKPPAEKKEQAYVQCKTVGDDYDTPITFVFPVDDCPVSEKGQSFRMVAEARYQVFPPREGKQASHNFVVDKVVSFRRIQFVEQEVKQEKQQQPA